MRSLSLCVTLLLAFACSSLFAAGGPSPSPKKEPVTEMAIFSVPKLAKGTLVKDLLKVLADKPGVVAAKPDKRREQLRVTFQPGQANPRALLKLLSTVARNVRLEAVTSADPNSPTLHDCGACPFAAGCKKDK